MTICVASQKVNIRTPQHSLQTAAFFESNVRVGLRRVRFGSGAKQTRKPTAHTKRTCKCRPFRKRLMGFEPTTFCMASRRSSQLSYSRKGAEYSPRDSAR